MIKKSSSRKTRAWIFGGGIVVVLAVVTVWLRLWVVRTTYAINQADQQIQILRRDRSQLELSVASLRSPRRLEALAKQSLKLSPPKPEQWVHLK